MGIDRRGPQPGVDADEQQLEAGPDEVVNRCPVEPFELGALHSPDTTGPSCGEVAAGTVGIMSVGDPPVGRPDTELARWANEWMHEICDPAVAAHCERSYQFVGLIAHAEQLTVDIEVVYIGTVLHDVGLAAPLAGPDRFEARGANAVRTLLLDAGMDPARIANVWDVIALHATSTLAAHKSPETYLANRGISIDVRGVGFETLPSADVRAVLDQWPRRTWAAAFERILIDEVRTNPHTARFSWLESVAVAHVPGYQPGDFLAGLHASSTFV